MSKMIKLTQGQYTIVDDEDYEELSLFKWRTQRCKRTGAYYAIRSTSKTSIGGTKTVLMHRDIMTAPKGMLVDHIDHNTLDNRRCNLRVCTQSQNQMNRGRPSNNTSGLKGVSWRKDRNKWRAQITVNKKSISLGHFINKKEASLAYRIAVNEYFGEYAFQSNIKTIKDKK